MEPWIVVIVISGGCIDNSTGTLLMFLVYGTRVLMPMQCMAQMAAIMYCNNLKYSFCLEGSPEWKTFLGTLVLIQLSPLYYF